MTTEVELPTWDSMKKPYKEYEQQLTEYFTAIGDGELLNKDKKPTATATYLPVVSTAEAFIVKCKGHSQAELLVSMAGLEKTAAQIRSLKESELDQDAPEQYKRRVKRHNENKTSWRTRLRSGPAASRPRRRKSRSASAPTKLRAVRLT